MNALIAVAAALTWTALAYATRRREVLMGADEGYLWYGTQRLLAGEQPVRDFRSYEPGRYWCCAAVEVWHRRGLVSCRLAAHLTVGLALALLGVALAAAGAPPAVLLALPIVVLSWRRNHFKLFDTAALAAVAAGGTAVMNGMAGSHLLLGAAVGGAAVMGLNLGLYGGVAASVVLALSLAAGSTTANDLAAVLVGGIIGLLPLGIWFLAARGTVSAVWRERVVVPIHRGSTNLPLPVPWLWRPDVPPRGTSTAATRFLTRAGFSVLPAIAVVAAMGSSSMEGAASRVVPLAAVGLAAWHHALSRADLAHLGLPAPFLLLSLALLPSPWGIPWLLIATAACIPLIRDLHPRLLRRRTPTSFVRRTLDGEAVWVPRGFARELDAVSLEVDRRVQLAALPYGVSLIAALGRRSAVRDTYCVYPVTDEEDVAMTQELDRARPVVVLIDDRPLDERNELRFSATHPMTWSWLNSAGTRLDPARGGGDALPAEVSLWRVGPH